VIEETVGGKIVTNKEKSNPRETAEIDQIQAALGGIKAKCTSRSTVMSPCQKIEFKR
jgi:thymidylate synthase